MTKLKINKKDWKLDEPTKAQLNSIIKMTTELGIKPPVVKNKGHATELILGLKEDIKNQNNSMKNFFGWK